MKNLKLFILSMAITNCVGVNNIFCMENNEYDTSGSSDNELGKITSVIKTIRINGKSFQVTPEEMMNYPVLGYFYRNYINQLEADDESNDGIFSPIEESPINHDNEYSYIFKDSERTLKNEDEDAKIFKELTKALEKAKKKSRRSKRK